MPNKFGAQKIRYQPMAKANGMSNFRMRSPNTESICPFALACPMRYTCHQPKRFFGTLKAE
jgi:hypothetical protein